MAADINKHLDRARRNLEKNKLRDAITEYQAVVDQSPGYTEAIQALADIYTRLNEPAQAAHFYGSQFDRLLEVGDAAKASAIFSRFLRSFPQPPDRLMRYAALLQRQGKHSEAVEQYGAAAQLFLQQRRDIEALACYESIALLDPENSARHVTLGELAERLRHADLAARSFLRAGQLVLTSGALEEALDYFGRAHLLAPQDRSGALLFAEAKLRKGDAEGAVALLEPLTPNEKDLTFLALFGESLLRTGRLDSASNIFELFYTQKPEGFAKLFEIAAAHLRAGDDAKAAAVLVKAKDRMRKARKDGELASQIDRLAAAHPNSLVLAETIARTYEELNREAKYFDALVRLFDLYLAAGRIKEACETLDRLIDIDPYDYRNHERIAKLEGSADPAFLQNVLSRVAKAATVSTRNDGFSGAGSDATAPPASEDSRSSQALEDLIVQVEIFLQYSLRSKAVERLTKIAELFPGEEETDERLRSLYDRANWWPKGEPTKRVVAPAPVTPAPSSSNNPVSAQPAVVNPADTHRDLATIAEINRLMYRQSTPREVVAASAAEIGKHLGVARCLISIGNASEAGQLGAEYFAPGLAAVGADAIPRILALASKATADPLGGIELNVSNAVALREIGIESALAVVLTDKETQAPSGTLLVGDAHARKWKPNESFFLQAVGDQLVLSVNHTRLRSLVRSLAVADEKTGLLSRGAYLDCLLAESNRARSQGTSLSLVLLQIDRGSELVREQGDAVDRYMEQLARALSPAVRQTDIIVKYTAWSLAFILPNTSLEDARSIAEKLLQVTGAVRPSWEGSELTVSAVAAEATSRPGDEIEDRVTEWINRAESGLDEARQRGGGSLVALATP
jgi:diguanylate cyclase (GGDEF)-like protein